MATPLPTPRALITSLFNSLTTPPPSSTLPTDTGSSNPLHSLPPSQRALLTTLHVIFPPGMLMHALDLLDRGLITKINYYNAQDPEGSQEEGHHPTAPQTSIYKVHSSSHAIPRFSSTAAAPPPAESYTTYLDAWNCSCAAFAFSSYAPAACAAAVWGLPSSSEGCEDPGEESTNPRQGTGREWEFGGLRFDGVGNREGGVPVCKHLLACVLAERWWDVLGGLVNVRVVGREEMAGLGGEG